VNMIVCYGQSSLVKKATCLRGRFDVELHEGALAA